ncbi:MAG: translation initiation factor IF-2 [Proteobacteria bacterium]|nr:translation initiation factor IF-2 [Pseudomonadota bacterium]
MSTGAKMRVYEIARELKVSNKELISKIRAIGLEVNNHMSSLDADDVSRLKRSMERDRLSKTETKRLSPSVLRRRSKGDGAARRRVVAADADGHDAARESPGPVAAGPSRSPRVEARPAERSRVRSAGTRAERAEAKKPVEPVRRVEKREARVAEPTPPVPSVAPVARRVADAEVVQPRTADAEVVQPRTAEPEAAEPTVAATPAVESAPAEPKPAEAAPVEIEAAEPELVEPSVVEPEVATPEAVVPESEQPPAVEPSAAEPTPVEVIAAEPTPVEAKAAEPTPVEPKPEPEVVEATTVEPEAAEPTKTVSEPEETEVETAPVAEAAGQAEKTEPTPPPIEDSKPAETTGDTVIAQTDERLESPVQPVAPAEVKPAVVSAPAEPARSEPSPAEAEKAAEPAKLPRTPVVIPGPPVVTIGSPEPPAAPADKPPARSASAQPIIEKRRRRQLEKKRPTTVQDVAAQARTRFEEELARARRRVSQREEAEKKKREEEDRKLRERDPNRPQPGTVINLPAARIKITERAPSSPRQIPGQGQIRGRFASQRNRPGGTRKQREFARKRQQKQKGKSTQITTPAEHKRVIRMEDTVAIHDIARSMGVKANEVLKKLWGMGMVGVNINASIDFDTAQILASEFGYEVQNVAFKEEEIFVDQPDEAKDLQVRAPVVTVMGHVDHGKTSLLDYIRKSRVAAGEAGGITQHVAAYKVSAGQEHGDVVFLDTPGHEAFTEMRARGAQATDIVVLVVAANDGVMPQTIEALNHAKDAKVSIIVAVNKCDLPDAKPDQVRTQLAEHGLIPEEWGGDTLYVNVSAVKGEGISELLESISLTAELLELRANPRKPAVGVVIEAKLDRNRGPMATVLIQQGELKTGSIVVAGRYYGKVRAMLNDLGKPIKIAGPSTPIELLGLDGVPDAGERLNVADDEKTAKQVVEHRRQQFRKKELATTGKISLENLMERIQEGETQELKVVLKADVQGSAEALKAALIKQSTEKVRVNVISDGVGGITETDVNLAKAGGAIIVGFHVRPAGKSAKLAEKEDVEIKLYNVIYEALEEVRKAMAGLLEPVKREEETGKIEIRETFHIPRVGTVAGCMVLEGKIHRRSYLRVVRDAVQIYEGKVGSLRRFKEDVGEVEKGYECGLMVQGFNDIQVGDIVEAYEIIEEAAQL